MKSSRRSNTSLAACRYSVRLSFLSAFLFVGAASASAYANPSVVDLVPGSSADRWGAVIAGPTIGHAWTYTSSGHARLFQTDGTATGTAPVGVFAPSGQYSVSLTLLASTSKGLFFSSKASTEVGLFLRSPSGAVTKLSAAATNHHLGELSSGRHAFREDGSTTTMKQSLVITDGTASGTKRFTVPCAAAFSCAATAFGDAVYYPLGNLGIGKHDGTGEVVLTPQPSVYLTEIAACGNVLYAGGAGKLYATNAGANPTLLMSARLVDPVCVDGKLVFAADTAATGYEPYVTDGTVAGTFLLKDINLGAGDSTSKLAGRSTVGPDRVYFTADDGTGSAAWVTDGTKAGTKMIAASPGTVAWVAPTTIAGKAYFTAGGKLYETDGTSASQRALGNVTAPERAAVLGTKLLYNGGTTSATTGKELAVIDVAAPFADAGVVAPPTGDAGTVVDGGTSGGSTGDGGAGTGGDARTPNGGSSEHEGESASDPESATLGPADDESSCAVARPGAGARTAGTAGAASALGSFLFACALGIVARRRRHRVSRHATRR